MVVNFVLRKPVTTTESVLESICTKKMAQFDIMAHTKIFSIKHYV